MDIYIYIFSAVAVIITSLWGSSYTSSSVRTEWYKCIKPRGLTPPSFVFPIVWTILYFTLFLSIARAIRERYTIIFILLMVTLILNVLWCYYYFKLRDITGSLMILIVLVILAIMIIIIAIYKKDYHLANLVIPYLLWISYASILNYFSISKLLICKDLQI